MATATDRALRITREQLDFLEQYFEALVNICDEAKAEIEVLKDRLLVQECRTEEAEARADALQEQLDRFHHLKSL